MQKNPLHEREAALDARVDGIYRVLKGRLNLDSLIPTCIEVAKEIESLNDISGKEKLDLLQKVLRQAVKESEKSTEEKQRLLVTIDTIVPMVVQAAIMASKSPIVAEVQAACVGFCIPSRVKKCACKKGQCNCIARKMPALPPNFVE